MAKTKHLFNRRKGRTRQQLQCKSGQRPRLSVFRSGKHIYAQVIDDRRQATLVEASMLGRSSVGVDIDPLSVAITRAKLDLLTCKPEELSRAIAQMGEPSGGHYEMPRVMARKFERKGTEAEKESYEVEIAGWRAALERVESVRLKRVLSMALSDAILRKFNVRMMGTGVGRFALEIRRRSLSGMVRKNLEQLVTRARLCQDLLRDYDLKPAPARVLRGDATALELPDASVHGILTSPPYLPASSGREAYLVGKSLSLTALGLMTEAEIAQAEALLGENG